MLKSMTGFAALGGEADGLSWAWDMRSVNARGLDIRLRVPDWIEGLEQGVRGAISKELGRGSVQLNLRVNKGDEQGVLTVNHAQLTAALTAVAAAEKAASENGVTLAATSAADLLAVRGVMEVTAPETDTKALLKKLMDQLPELLAGFVAMRSAEGEALAIVLAGQVDEIERLTLAAATAAEARRGEAAASLREALARVMENSEGADADRVAQELAILAVKTDVTEEIDRLKAHVTAARELMQVDGPVGRKLDFLMQEFNREANTLCSKAQSSDLTRIGLDLKAVIDQMREQVQNVE